MDDIIIVKSESKSPPNSKKRSLDLANAAIDAPIPFTSTIHPPTSPDSTNSPHANHGATLPSGISREPSPALSTSSSLTSICTTPLPFGLDGTAQSTISSGDPPKKKRQKLTPGEQLQRQRDKQAKEEDKEVKRREREIVKQQKEEEKRKKQEAEEQKARKKQEEEEKKAKAQPKLKSFFAAAPKASPFKAPSIKQEKSSSVPTLPQAATTPNAGIHTIPSGPFQVKSEFETPAQSDSNSIPSATFIQPSRPIKSDYEKTFFPFFPLSNSIVAPLSRFSWDQETLQHFDKTFDTLKKGNGEIPVRTLDDLLSPEPWERASTIAPVPVKNIISRLSGSGSSREALEELRAIPIRTIYFSQDVRPPYIGTYSRQLPARLARNPLLKARPDTDYDDDSEAEWEDDAGAEDVDSEVESDVESEATDDIGGFLDDEGDGLKRGLLTDMEPVCSGLCWEDEQGHVPAPELRLYRMRVIHSDHNLPIDPFSTKYWADDFQTITPKPIVPCDSTAPADDLNIKREPLQPLQNQGSINTPLPTSDLVAPKSKAIKTKTDKPPPQPLTGAELDRFKQTIVGSAHNKQGLLAIIKKESFPNVTAAVLKETLDLVAVRVGRVEAEKRWALKESATV